MKSSILDTVLFMSKIIPKVRTRLRVKYFHAQKNCFLPTNEVAVTTIICSTNFWTRFTSSTSCVKESTIVALMMNSSYEKMLIRFFQGEERLVLTTIDLIFRLRPFTSRDLLENEENSVLAKTTPIKIYSYMNEI